MSMRFVLLSSVVVLCLLVFACDLVDPTRSNQVEDAEVFGNLLEVTRDGDESASWIVKVRVGAPRALRSAEEEQGRPTPSVEEGLVATVRVTGDTLVVADDDAASVDEIAPGTEVVVQPVPGTSRMQGSDDLRLDAQLLMDFATYRLWRLPKLAGEPEEAVDNVERINSSGAELSPVPVGDGRVLYFTAHLRPPATAEHGWHGAVREGLQVSEEVAGSRERSYRSELEEEGWTPPQLVEFPGLEDAGSVRVSWVSGDETQCLLTVADADGGSWMASATRLTARDPWGVPERLDVLGDDASDGVYLTGSRTKIVFVSVRGGNLLLYDPATEGGPLPLEPQINTFGNEWSPRTGPAGELFFCREDRQLVFKGGRVRPLRLPGPHRVQFSQAAPTEDGRWLFFCVPRYRPVELDHDIMVARLDDEGLLGAPVPVDEWRQ
jgi:hypothetical protein